jgi:aminoglycoside phosphotransferase
LDETIRELCAVVDAHVRPLRNGRLGKSARIGGFQFELVAKTRNAVYRIDGEPRWYLKINSLGESGMARRELLGAEVVQKTICGHPVYGAPLATHGSVESAYVLCAEVIGIPLSNLLYRACLQPTMHALHQVCATFHSLGEILGQLHRDGCPNAERMSRQTAAEELRNAIVAHEQRDDSCSFLDQWLTNVSHDREVTFLHGNPRRSNILFGNGKLCLIDFEHCGGGSRYDELSKVCADLAMTQTVALFPWKRCYLALDAFLEGYRHSFPYNAQTLTNYLAMRIGAHYAWKCGRTKKVTVLRLPASKARLKSMTMGLIQGCSESVLAGVTL